MEEAIARGQLAFQDARFPHKKRRVDQDGRPAANGQGQMRGRGRGRGGMHYSRNQGSNNTRQAATVSSEMRHSLPPKPQVDGMVRHGPGPENVKASVEADPAHDSDSDSPPEVVSSKPSIYGGASDQPSHVDDINVSSNKPPEAPHPALKAAPKPLPRQPRKPPQNPFASRPALLRNVKIFSLSYKDILLTDVSPTAPLARDSNDRIKLIASYTLLGR
jgi:hypothetical protein